MLAIQPRTFLTNQKTNNVIINKIISDSQLALA